MLIRIAMNWCRGNWKIENEKENEEIEIDDDLKNILIIRRNRKCINGKQL